MTDLQQKAALAGLFFGIWPLLMNKSGLPGNVSSVVFGLGVTVLLIPFAAQEWRSENFSIVPFLIIGAWAVGAFGLSNFNGMLAKATKEQVGSLFVVMIAVQICVPAIHNIVVNGGLTLWKAIGFASAFLAAYALNRS